MIVVIRTITRMNSTRFSMKCRGNATGECEGRGENERQSGAQEKPYLDPLAEKTGQEVAQKLLAAAPAPKVVDKKNVHSFPMVQRFALCPVRFALTLPRLCVFGE